MITHIEFPVFASFNLLGELGEILLRNNTSTRADRELHLADLLVDLLHELDDEIYNLVLEHRFGVSIGDQEAHVIALCNLSTRRARVRACVCEP